MAKGGAGWCGSAPGLLDGKGLQSVFMVWGGVFGWVFNLSLTALGQPGDSSV